MLAGIGMLVMSSGLVLIVGASPAHAKTPVTICHATSSDTNPYVLIVVDDDSAAFQGHLAHRNDPNKKWKSAGEWNGDPHVKGDPKPDLIADYTDENDVLHTYDGTFSEGTCEAEVQEIETTASASFVDPTCENENTASYSTEGEHVTFELAGTVAPGESVTVTATVEDGYTFAGDVQSLEFAHTFGAAEDCTVTEPPVEEPPTITPEPTVDTPTPTVVRAGLLSNVGSDQVQQGLALLLAGMIVMVIAGGLGLVRPNGGTTQN